MKTNYIMIANQPGTAIDIGRLAGKLKELILSKNHEITSKGSNYNGYGYSDWDYYYTLNEKDYNEVMAFVKCKENTQKHPKVLTEEQKREKWAKRLAKLSGIDIEEARKLALEKIKYHEERINELVKKDDEHSSIMREKLIRKMKRENPLRYIKDEAHAENILSANRRHNESDYEFLLQEGKELVQLGVIDNAKEYARRNFKYNN